MPTDNQISALERITKLRDSGALSEAEFEAQKAQILSKAATETAPFYRRLWFVVLLTCLLVTFPVALVILLTGPVYRTPSGEPARPIKSGTRFVYAGLLGLWLAALVVRAVLHPQSLETAWKDNAVDGSHAAQTASGPTPPDACDSSDATDMVKSAIENSATSAIITRKVLDYGHAKELWFDADDNTRFCQADAELNTGESQVSFRLYYGPSGSELVEVKEGPDAYGTAALKVLAQAAKAAAAAKAGEHASQGPQTAQADGTPQQAEPAPTQVQASAGTKPSQPDVPKDPLESRYTPDYGRCLNSGDAANGVTSAMVDCTDKELAAQDRMLNNTYRTTMADLSPDQQAALRDAQRKWIKDRDAKCVTENQTGGTIDRLGRPSCLLSATIRRTMELEAMQTH